MVVKNYLITAALLTVPASGAYAAPGGLAQVVASCCSALRACCQAALACCA